MSASAAPAERPIRPPNLTDQVLAATLQNSRMELQGLFAQRHALDERIRSVSEHIAAIEAMQKKVAEVIQEQADEAARREQAAAGQKPGAPPA